MTGNQRRDEKLSHLVRLAQQRAGNELSASEQSGLGRLEHALAARRPRFRGSWVMGLAFAAALGGVLLFLVPRFWRARALSFAVVGGSVSDGGYIRPASGGDALLRFSDGSEVQLDEGSRARVTELTRTGARVLLESGKARVHVVHRPDTKWALDAGPFTVQVTGTEFDLAWLSNEEVLDLQLRKGSVVVRGPLTPAGVEVRVGQHLLANLRQGSVVLGESAAEGWRGHTSAPVTKEEETTAAQVGSDAPSTEARASTGPTPDGATHRRGRSSHPASAAPSWSTMVAQGQFDEVLEEADRRGFSLTLSRSSLDDLSALADASRYLRRDDWARRALLAERGRFPNARRAHEAAFFLGGLSEGESELAVALDWYDRYLGEAPRGAYASQALGRKMVLVRKLKGPGPAAQIAEEYLQRFSEGPYASSAKKLTLP